MATPQYDPNTEQFGPCLRADFRRPLQSGLDQVTFSLAMLYSQDGSAIYLERYLLPLSETEVLYFLYLIVAHVQPLRVFNVDKYSRNRRYSLDTGSAIDGVHEASCAGELGRIWVVDEVDEHKMVVPMLRRLLRGDFGHHCLHATAKVSSHPLARDCKSAHLEIDVELEILDVMAMKPVVYDLFKRKVFFDFNLDVGLITVFIL